MDEIETWRKRALCKDYPVEYWYPENPTAQGAFAQAKSICDRCPVESECLDYAVANAEIHGMWGGKTERQRYKLMRARGVKPDRSRDDIFYIRQCQVCYSEFRPVQFNSRFCSAQHAQYWYNKTSKERKDEERLSRNSEPQTRL